MGSRSYSWSSQLAMGNKGARDVRDWLVRQGHDVESVEKDKLWRKRDVDFLVDGKMVEVKTDSHMPGSIFAELTVDGKPGYLFKSRADVLVYYYPKADLLYWVDMPKLVWWVSQQKPGLRVFEVRSNRQGREWLAEGVGVPAEALKAIRALVEFRLHDEEDVAA